jgi:hypothetical protein
VNIHPFGSSVVLVKWNFVVGMWHKEQHLYDDHDDDEEVEHQQDQIRLLTNMHYISTMNEIALAQLHLPFLLCFASLAGDLIKATPNKRKPSWQHNNDVNKGKSSNNRATNQSVCPTLHLLSVGNTERIILPK